MYWKVQTFSYSYRKAKEPVCLKKKTFINIQLCKCEKNTNLQRPPPPPPHSHTSCKSQEYCIMGKGIQQMEITISKKILIVELE